MDYGRHLRLKTDNATTSLPCCLKLRLLLRRIRAACTSSDEPDVLHVREIWTDAATHQASLTLPVTQHLITQARPLLEHVERVLEDQPLGGKGLI